MQKKCVIFHAISGHYSLRSLWPLKVPNFVRKLWGTLGFQIKKIHFKWIKILPRYFFLLLPTLNWLIVELNHNSRIYNSKKVIIFAQNVDIPATVELHVLKQKERFTWPFYKKKAFSGQANNKCKRKFFIQYTRRHNRHPKFCHPYFHWYFYNQNMCNSLYVSRRSSSNLDTIWPKYLLCKLYN